MIDHFQFSSLIEYCVAKSSLELRSKKLFRVGNLSKLLFSDLIFNLDEKGCLTRRQGGREGFFLLFFIEIWFITCSSSSQWFSGVDLWKSGLKPKGDKKILQRREREMILFPSAEYAWKNSKKIKINMEKKKSCFFMLWRIS